MSTLAAQNPTLLDLAKRLDPDNSIADIVEILNETNEILTDMTWKEGNLLTGNRTTIRSGIPAPTWRKMYGGVQPNKSTTVQVTDNTGMMEAYAEVDKALADLNGNTAAFRLSEDKPHIEGMSQDLATKIFYGNEGVAPETFTGFSVRFNSKSAQNAANVIDAGDSTGALGSIWLIVWGDNTCHGIVPKGSQAGLQMEDKGQVTIENADGAGGRMEAYRTHYRMDAGLTIRDWRYIVRICNINRTALKTLPTQGTDVVLPDLMFDALERVPNLGTGRPVFYMDRTMRKFFRKQEAYLTKGSTLDIANVGGTRSMMFDEVPIRRVDVLAATEARVV